MPLCHLSSHPPIRSLWVGSALPAAQAACIRSFLRVGHVFELFCYGVPRNLPVGVIVRDAREYLPADRVFAYGPAAGKSAGSLGAFSNLFRYMLLEREGGWWVDTDVFCLRPFPALAPGQIVVASERSKSGHTAAATCVLGCGSPAAPLMRRCLDESLAHDPARLIFGQTGPKLFDRLLTTMGLRDALAAQETFCPVNWTEHHRLLASPAPTPDPVLPNSLAIHLWNEMWRLTGHPIPWPGPRGSLLRRLADLIAPIRRPRTSC